MTENVTRLFGGDGDLRPDTQLPIDDIVDGDTDPQGRICAAVMLMQRLGKLRFELQVQAQVRLATSCCSLAQAYDDDGVPF